jgi:hypothetical protein
MAIYKGRNKWAPIVIGQANFTQKHDRPFAETEFFSSHQLFFFESAQALQCLLPPRQ